ncbi:HNH endonuclease signature motif containing protein [Cellulomonas sp. URHD0024]|uniref:HNH endonuclease signature motif containing protein n=1 Tax=Cellulomonas sp. URHD0024 TaxID=1302620 RepID=UPI00040BB608|nr:HNH endonuclease signature motif containing protein [Cellulomonas sp. URHD0024]
MFDVEADPIVGVVAGLAVDVAAQVRDAAAALARDARTCASWSASRRSAALVCVRSAEAALAEARAHLLVAVRDSGDLEQPGDRSFENALGRTTRTGTHEATRQVRQADALVSMPSVAAGVRDGLVPLGHLDTLARVAATAAPEVAAALRAPGAQDRVVQLAQSLSAPDFAKSLAQYVASQDPAALEVAFEAQRRERFLTLSTQPHGVFIKGRLDTTAAQSLRTALDLMDQHADDHRTASQASADALTLLAERTCAGTTSAPRTGPSVTAVGMGVGVGAGSAGTGADVGIGGAGTGADMGIRAAGTGADMGIGGAGTGADMGIRAAGTGADVGADLGVGSARRSTTIADGDAGPALAGDDPSGRPPGTAARAHLSLLVPAETFVELLRHQHMLDADPRVAPLVAPPWSSVAPWRQVPPATLEDGTPVPMSELARALCDGDITRIVMSAEGLPLDVGRSKRLFTPAQRRAAIARDQQCIWNGCTTAASRCEMHHLRWWDAHHGPTSLTNAALVCPHHHRLIHQLHLTVQRLAQPPGWVSREQRAGRGIAPSTPGVRGRPMRYVFRDPTGSTINRPEGPSVDWGDRESATSGRA